MGRSSANCDARRPLAIDLDGTFFTSDEDAMARNKSALIKLRQLGIEAFYCTGRTLDSALALLGDDVGKASGYKGYPGVYCNGAQVYGLRGQVLEDRRFSKAMLRTFCEYLVANGYESRVVFFDKEHCFVISNGPNLLKPILCRHTSTRVSFRVVDVETLVDSSILKIEFLGIDIRDAVDLKPQVDYVAFDLTLLQQLVPPGVNKAQGLKAIAKELKVDPKEIAFIGDGVNDVEAMQQSDYSFAVANASDDVKQHAKQLLTKTNRQGAFCEATWELYQI